MKYNTQPLNQPFKCILNWLGQFVVQRIVFVYIAKNDKFSFLYVSILYVEELFAKIFFNKSDAEVIANNNAKC